MNEHVTTALNRIRSIAESDELLPIMARAVIARDRNDRPGDLWSIRNRILMHCAGTDDGRGFQQWKNVGRFPQKGSHAFHILAPKIAKIEDDDESRVLQYFISIPVFRYEDTTGAEIEYPDYKPHELPPFADLPAQMGIDVVYLPWDGNQYGSYNPSKRRITLNTHDARTFFHELGHAIHNEITPLKGGQIPSQEITAELVAGTMAILYGMDQELGQSQDYIKHYAAHSKIAPCIPTASKILERLFPATSTQRITLAA